MDRWVQILSVLAILAGLGFVAAELRQNQRLVRAELGSGSISYRQAILDSVQGEGVAAALAQALVDPEALSAEQQYVLDAYYANIVGQVLRQSYLLRLGVFRDPLPPFVAIQARLYFGNPYARAWWREHRGSYPDGLVELLDEALETVPDDRDQARFARLREAAAR